MSTATVDAPSENNIRTLTALDTCDTGDCSGRAYWLAVFPDSGFELQFCIHHGRKAEEGLKRSGATIHEQADDLK